VWENLVVEGPLIEEGHIATGEKPGLGLTLNEDVAREYAVEELGFFD
jgi:L-alanine-DL-glutamate epimerase-like enolase superfamily enzyme